MRLLGAIMFVACLAVSAVAHTGDVGGIAGRVIGEESGEPLAFANISARGTVWGCITNSKGVYYLPEIEAGEREIMVSMMGYETLTRTVNVLGDRTVTVDFVLKQSTIELSEFVVTGTRTTRYVKDVPVRTQVVTRQSIKDAGACDIYEALEGTPGIRVEQQCQFCNFSQVRVQGLGPDHTQLLVDGQPVYSGLAAVYGLQQMSASAIDRIEVVKGAGSSLYGSGAIAGAINLVTRRPKSRPEADLTLELGEHGTQRYAFSASQQFGTAGVVVFAQKNRGDIIDETGDGIGRDEVLHADQVSDRVCTDLTTAGFNAIFDGALGMDQVVVRGRTIHEIRQGGELFNDSYSIPDDVYENPFTLGTERIITDRYEGEVSLAKGLSGGRRASVSLAFSRHDRNATNDTFVGDYEEIHGELPSIELLRPYLASEDLLSANASYEQPLFGTHRLMLGAQVTYDELEESGMYMVVDEEDENYGEAYRSTSQKHATDIGVYVQDEFVLSDGLEFVLGVRYDAHSSEDDFRGSGSVAPDGVPGVEYSESSVNPRMAVRYNPIERLALRASVGTGFRVPYGFSEDLHLCSGSPRVWKGGDLQPERSVSYNISADYYGTRHAVGVALYRVDLRDKVGLVDAGSVAASRGYTYEWENVDDAFVHGVELDARCELTTALALEGYGTVSRGEYDSARADWIGTQY
ncbi:TonB-dependent receptor, partial [bacterium]|nr:TonB-dependent receptor [bacterium]